MKKLTVSILTVALLLLAALGVGIFTASATGGDPCISAPDCTGCYENGICSADPTHYQPAVPNGVGANGQPLYEISNAGQLYWFAALCDSGVDLDTPSDSWYVGGVSYREYDIPYNAVLTADVTLNESVLVNGALRSDTEGLVQWDPIGFYEVEEYDCYIGAYTGTLDGNGHTIRGLYFNDASAMYVGLLAVIGEGGVVEELTVEDAYLHTRGCCGTFTSQNSGTVRDCTARGTVSLDHDEALAAGIAAINHGTIERCVNHASVFGGGDAYFLGGIASRNFGTIRNSANFGTIGVSENNQTGGIVYNNEGTIQDCYSSASLAGIMAGGIAACNQSAASIQNCYYNGELFDGGGICYQLGSETDVAEKTAAEFADGTVCALVGFHFGGTTTCKGKECELCGEVYGETDPEDHASTEYSNGFRVCCGTYEPAVQAGVGANGQPLYEISNAGQLFWFAEHVNMGEGNEKANAILKADIDLNLGYTFTFISDTGLIEVKRDGVTIAYLGTGIKGDASGANVTFDDTASFEGETYANADDAMQGPIELLSGIRVWSPIGSIPYAGSFDGNGKTVGGMYVNSPSDTQGLFAYNKGTVKHVGVVNSCVFGASYTGGIVGHNDGDVMNSYYAGIVIGNSSSNYVGGVAGHNDGIVADSYNTGVINGSFNVGGVVGDNGGDVVNCHNAGAVSVCNGDHSLGGVVGYNNGDVKNSYNVGPVSAGDSSNSVGGVIGYNYGDVEDSYNAGSVRIGNVSTSVGGVVGYNYGDIANSYNVGAVSCGENSSSVGGVAGDSYGDIVNSYNVGAVSGGNNFNSVGGVVGYNYGDIANSYNVGAISVGENSSSVGGVAGYNAYGSVNNSYNEGTVSVGESSNNVGGVLGHNSDSNVRNVYNKGAVSVGENSSSVGGVVGYNFSDMRNVYNVGAVSVGENSSYVGSVIGKHVDYNYNTVVNMYYLAGTAACGIGNTPEDTSTAIAKTEAEFKNGTVAWLLNDFVGYDIFGQTLSGEQADAAPVILTDSNRIYFGYITCDAAQTAPVYSNVSTATAEKPAHTMAAATCTAPSTCTACGHTEGGALGHSYDNVCDTSCNTCNEMRTVGEHADADENGLCDACNINIELPKEGLPAGAVVGIVLGAAAILGAGGFCLYWFVIKKKNKATLSGD